MKTRIFWPVLAVVAVVFLGVQAIGRVQAQSTGQVTTQERPLYEYLKILQTHLETMHGTMGTMQGMMKMQSGMPGR